MEKSIHSHKSRSIKNKQVTESHNPSHRREEEDRIHKRREACKRYSQKSRQKEMAYLDYLQKEQKRLQKHISMVAPKVAMARRENAVVKAEVAEKNHMLNKLRESLYLKEVEYEQLSYLKDLHGIEIDPEDPEMKVPICDNCYQALVQLNNDDENRMMKMGFDGSQMANGFSASRI